MERRKLENSRIDRSITSSCGPASHGQIKRSVRHERLFWWVSSRDRFDGADGCGWPWICKRRIFRRYRLRHGIRSWVGKFIWFTWCYFRLNLHYVTFLPLSLGFSSFCLFPSQNSETGGSATPTCPDDVCPERGLSGPCRSGSGDVECVAGGQPSTMLGPCRLSEVPSNGFQGVPFVVNLRGGAYAQLPENWQRRAPSLERVLQQEP